MRLPCNVNLRDLDVRPCQPREGEVSTRQRTARTKPQHPPGPQALTAVRRATSCAAVGEGPAPQNTASDPAALPFPRKALLPKQQHSQCAEPSPPVEPHLPIGHSFESCGAVEPSTYGFPTCFCQRTQPELQVRLPIWATSAPSPICSMSTPVSSSRKPDVNYN